MEPVRRVLVRAFGGPDQLALETVAEAPLVGAPELLVDVEATGINYLDVYQRSGRYRAAGPAPAIRPDQLVSHSLRLGARSVFNYTAARAQLQPRAQAEIDGIRGVVARRCRHLISSRSGGARAPEN